MTCRSVIALSLLVLGLAASAVTQNSTWDNESERETESKTETGRTKSQVKCWVPILTCRKLYYMSFLVDNMGCPAPTCRPCTSDSSDKPECRGITCPPPQAVICQQGTYLTDGRDARGCPVIGCARCSGDSTRDRPGCVGELACPPMATPLCDVGYYVREYIDRYYCRVATCARCTNANQDQVGCPVVCPELDMPTCRPTGEFVQYSRDANGCQAATCARCTDATANEKGCGLTE